MASRVVTHKSPSIRPQIGYIPAFDGLRAVAVLLVLGFHMVMPIRFPGGAVGVDIFFVLSGFLISGILLRQITSTGTIELRAFYLRRLIRLYPALLVVAAFVVPAGLLIMQDTGHFIAETLFALTYTTPVALIIDWGASSVWRTTWTLGIEEFFYLIWPAVLLLIHRRIKPTLPLAAAVGGAGIGIVLVIRIIEITAGDTPDLLRGGGLLVGAGLAIAFHARPDLRVHQVWGWAGFVLVATAVTIGTTRFLTAATLLMAIVGSALIVSHLARPTSGPLVRILSARPVVYVGRISYELYLWHWPLLILMQVATGFTAVELIWVAAPLTFALSAATHHLLASKVDAWKSAATHRLRQPAR